MGDGRTEGSLEIESLLNSTLYTELKASFSEMWVQFSSGQSISYVWLFVTPSTASWQNSLSITNSWVYLNLCPLSRWCYPTIPSSVVPFSSCLQSFPASGFLKMSQFFISGGQSIGVSALALVLPMNIQDWFPRIVWLDLHAVQGTLKSLLQQHSSKASILRYLALFIVQLSHPYMTIGKKHSFD